jgi:Protein of unknown function (DUF3141)
VIIFVSGKVATKEDAELVQCMDLIDLLSPGLYEAVITDADPAAEDSKLVHGRYRFALERRTLSDIRALGGNDAEHDRRFATVARLSQVNESLYQTFVRPTVRAAVTPAIADAIRQVHPKRFGLFSDRNPFVAAIAPFAEAVRQNRRPAAQDNPLFAIECLASGWIETSLKLWGGTRDALVEQFFLNFYGSPLLQSLVGLNAENTDLHRRIERDVTREANANRKRSELESAIDRGGVVEAFVRAQAYTLKPIGGVDDQGFTAFQEMSRTVPAKYHPDFARFPETVRHQFLILHLDEARAIEALPKLAATAEDRRLVLECLHRIGRLRRPDLTEEQRRRFFPGRKTAGPGGVTRLRSRRRRYVGVTRFPNERQLRLIGSASGGRVSPYEWQSEGPPRGKPGTGVLTEISAVVSVSMNGSNPEVSRPRIECAKYHGAMRLSARCPPSATSVIGGPAELLVSVGLWRGARAGIVRLMPGPSPGFLLLHIG